MCKHTLSVRGNSAKGASQPNAWFGAHRAGDEGLRPVSEHGDHGEAAVQDFLLLVRLELQGQSARGVRTCGQLADIPDKILITESLQAFH